MKPNKVQLIAERIKKLSIGESISKVDFILVNWDRSTTDYFIERSFDVAFCKAKKQFPDKKFKCKGRLITRIE